MKLPTESKEIIRDFFYNRFWPAFPLDMYDNVSSKKGSKTKSHEALEKYILKICGDQDPTEELEKIFLAMEAHKKYDREARSRGIWIARWKNVEAYINQRCWDIDLGSHAELKQKSVVPTCGHPDCTEPVHGPSFKLCTVHLAESIDPLKEKRREALRKAGVTMIPGESKQEFFMRCRQFAFDKGFKPTHK